MENAKTQDLTQNGSSCWKLLGAAWSCWGLLGSVGKLLAAAGAARKCWGLLGAAKGCRQLLGLLEAAGSWELLGAAKGCMQLLGAAGSYWGLLGGVIEEFRVYVRGPGPGPTQPEME